MEIPDDELKRLLLSYVSDSQRKTARVIMSVFQDIGYERTLDRLYGFGDKEADELLERSIDAMKELVSEGRIEAFGDLSRPRFSEVKITSG